MDLVAPVISHTISFPLFGDRIVIVLEGVDEQLGRDLEPDIEREALRLQRIFNLYDPHSELSLLNHRRTMTCSPELVEVVRFALQLCEKTRGAYDISKGAQFLARKSGIEREVDCTYRDIEVTGSRGIDAEKRASMAVTATVTLWHKDALVDLGSVAKGYIADRLRAFIVETLGVESVFIDARGDIVAAGSAPQRILVQHPRDPAAAATTIQIADCAVATSGDYRQFVGDFARSHIVGARGSVSVTVIAPTLLVADGLATALFVLDPAGCAPLMAQHPDACALAYALGGTDSGGGATSAVGVAGVAGARASASLVSTRYNGFERYELGDPGPRMRGPGMHRPEMRHGLRGPEMRND
jgi:FAD:protein FMN transferase